MSTERDRDLDARWADIVAHWDDPAPEVTDDLVDELPAHPPETRPAPRGIPADDEVGVGVGADDPIEAGWRSYEPPGEDEHWEPPAPAPLPPAHDLGFWATLVGLVGGPALIFLTVVLRPDDVGPWGWIGAAMAVAGFVLLVRRGAGDDDENDHGIRL